MQPPWGVSRLNWSSRTPPTSTIFICSLSSVDANLTPEFLLGTQVSCLIENQFIQAGPQHALQGYMATIDKTFLYLK